MSSPLAERVGLHVPLDVQVLMWPLACWVEKGRATIECGRCVDGLLVDFARLDDWLTVAEMVQRIERHIEVCEERRSTVGHRPEDPEREHVRARQVRIGGGADRTG
jgi:hypothetical protein